VTILVQDGKLVIGHVGLGKMKLLEFFSQNASKEDQEEQLENDLEKDVMGFILDDNDLYKEHIYPILEKYKKGKDFDSLDFKNVVKAGCLKYYKENEFNKDPNECFPKPLRDRLADNLVTILKKK